MSTPGPHAQAGYPAGHRVQEARRVLLYRLLAPWRRRGAALLQVGLRSGLMPDFFWDAGFDATGLDVEPAVRRAAELTGPRVDYAVGRPDSLPFDDGAYDHVVLVHLDLRSADILNEALRVAARGVLIVEWNRFALGGPGRHGQGCWPWALMGLARRACSGCSMAMFSALLFPPRMRESDWREADVPSEAPLPFAVRQSSPPSPDRAPRAGSPLGRAAGRMPEQADGLRTQEENKPSVMVVGRPEAPRSLTGRIGRLAFPLPVGALLGLRLQKSPLLMTPVGTVEAGRSARSYAADAVVSRVDGGNLARRSAGPPETD